MGIKNFPVRAGPCPSLHCPPPPPLLEKYIFFALPSMNGPLPAELKFRENTGKNSRYFVGIFHKKICLLDMR